MKAKSVKRREAIERQARYNALSPMEKLAKLDYYGLTASRERGRILKQIAENING